MIKDRVNELFNEVEEIKRDLEKTEIGSSDYNFLALKLDIALTKIQSFSRGIK